MFDKLKGLFKSKPPVELDVNDIPSFLEAEFGTELKMTRERINIMVEEVYKELQDIKEKITELKEKVSEDTYANSVKNKFCLRSLEQIENVGKPEIKYNSLKGFMKKTEDLTKGISNIGFKEMIHLRSFKEQMDSIALKIKLIIERNKRLDISLKNSALEKIAIIENKIKGIKSEQFDVNEINNTIKDSETAAAKTEGLLKERKKQFDEFLKSDDFVKLGSLSNELEDLEKSRSILKQKISTEFSGIDKALKKFQHSGFANREEDQLINNYITESDAFLMDSDLKIKGVLEKVKQKADSKELDIEGKRYDKILYLLKEINSLGEMRNKYRDTEKNIDEKNTQKNRILPITDKKAKKEQELTEHEKRLANINERKAEVMAELESKKKEIEFSRKELENMLKETLKRDVTIKL